MVRIQIWENAIHAIELPEIKDRQLVLEFKPKESIVLVSVAYATWEDVLFPSPPTQLVELEKGQECTYEGLSITFEDVIDQEEAGVYAEITYY
jgi:hypothetical protein